MTQSSSGASASTTPQGSAIERASVGRLAVREGAPLVRGHDVALVLDRAGAEQELPVVLAGEERERGRHGDELGALDGEDAVELGEAEVVADGQPELPALDLAS